MANTELGLRESLVACLEQMRAAEWSGVIPSGFRGYCARTCCGREGQHAGNCPYAAAMRDAEMAIKAHDEAQKAARVAADPERARVNAAIADVNAMLGVPAYVCGGCGKDPNACACPPPPPNGWRPR